MPPRRPGRLFLRMALTLGGALALAFAVAASLSIWIGTRALGRSVDQELSGIAHLVHLDVERFLKERRGDLQLCAEVEAMDDVVLGDVRFRIENQLIHLSRSYPGIYDELAVMDPNGEVVASTRVDRIGTRLPVQLMRLLDRGDGSLVGPGPQRVPGAPDPVLVMAQEIRSSVSHQPAGWLVALVRWSAVSNVVQSTSVEGRSQSREAFLILYQDDQPIAGHAEWRPGAFANDRRQLIHSRVLAHEDPRHYTGAETFVELAAGVSAAGWRVVFYRDAAEAFAPVRLFAWSVLAAGILGLLLAAALTLRAAGEFPRRVEVLRQGTQRLASGDYAHRVSDVRGDELAQLGESYNQMAEAMQAARARIEQSHAELEDSNRRLLEASRLKDEFLANTSHELRTPLNGILGFLGLVTDGLCDSPAEERDSVRLALECGHTLRLLIEDVLDVSYIEAGRLSLAMQNVAVAPAVERALAEMAPRARARGLELTGMPLADPALAVRADPQRLQQERRPLLDHAIKVTEGGSVTVACTAHEAAGHVCLEVRDTGIGIARDRQARVFERFVQGVGSATRKFGGTGLGHGGLHGARGRRPRVPRGPRHRDRHRARPPGARLRALRPGRRERDAQVRRHRARPLARARSGGDDGRRGPARERRRRLRHHRDRLAPGRPVRRRGPRSRAARAAPAPPPAGGSDAAGLAPGARSPETDARVEGPEGGPVALIVDDDPAIVTWLRSVLHAGGIRTAAVDSAERAWMMLRQMRPSLLVLDHALPSGPNARFRTGAQLARRMAENRSTAELPILLLSGHDPVALEGEGALPKAVRYLAKPVRGEELLAAVWEMIPRHEPHAVHVLLAHRDPKLLVFAGWVAPTASLRISLERNDASCLEALERRPQAFDVVLPEAPASRAEATTLLQRFAALAATPPLLVIAEPEMLADPSAWPRLHGGPMLELISKPDALAHPDALCQRLLVLGSRESRPDSGTRAA